MADRDNLLESCEVLYMLMLSGYCVFVIGSTVWKYFWAEPAEVDPLWLWKCLAFLVAGLAVFFSFGILVSNEAPGDARRNSIIATGIISVCVLICLCWGLGLAIWLGLLVMAAHCFAFGAFEWKFRVPGRERSSRNAAAKRFADKFIDRLTD